MNLELIILGLIFLSSAILLFRDFKKGLIVLLILSVLLHKELFSFYQWDFLPVRFFMVALSFSVVLKSVLWFYKHRTLRPLYTYLNDPVLLLLVLLWVVRAFSILFSLNLTASVFSIAFFTTVIFLALGLYHYYHKSPGEVLTLLKIYIAILSVMSLIALVQFFLNIKFGTVFGAIWPVPGNLPRVGAFFWDVNHFGGLLAGLLPVVGMLFLVSRSWKQRVLYFVMGLSMAGALLLTNSRTAWISAFVSFVVFCLLFMIRKFGYKGILAVVAALILVTVPMFVAYSDRESKFRAEVKQYFHYRIDSFDSHMLLLRGTWAVFEEYPYFGGGYGSFFEQFSKTKVAAEFYARDPAALSTRVPAHTIWGELIADTGAAGLLLFVLFVIVGWLPLVYIALKKDKKPENYLLGMGMASAIVGWLAGGIFYSYNSEFFWISFLLYFIWGIGALGPKKRLEAFDYFASLEKLAFTFLILLSALMIFWNLGKNHLVPWDEAIYSKIAKNMVTSGDYMVMNWVPERIWYEKPPLGMWLQAGSMQLFGFTEFAARLPSALLGLGTIVLVYLLAKNMFGKTAAFLSSFALLTTFSFLYYSRTSMLDVSATFFITLSMYLYWLQKEKQKFWLWILSGLVAGMAIMIKGVVGFIPFGVVALYELYLLFSKQSKISWKLILGGVLMLVAAAIVFMPWHIAMYVRFGQQFIDNYLGYHVLDRATSAIEDKGQPFWWYFIVIKVSMRIWFVVLIPAFILSLVRIFGKDKKHAFLVIWAVFVFLLFSASTSKLIWYIMPFYAPAAILVGYFTAVAITNTWKILLPKKLSLARGASLLLVVCFGLFYLFMNKDLVYTSDLTGAQAQLLEKKDEVFGLSAVGYIDKTELPLILYYSDGINAQTDYTPLKNKLKDVEPGERVVFMTKESRFLSLQEEVEGVALVKQIKEWVLGVKEVPELTPEQSDANLGL